jgi:RHS repeat-associated protein
MRIRALRLSALALLATTICSVPASAQLPTFNEDGYQKNREYFGQLPYENIDTLTGNLVLTFTDFVLPGNDGLDIRFQRTLNSKRRAHWRFGLAGVPETSLQYFGARHYASQTGRFTTVDPVLDLDAASVDPQRWNRYTYALNNPLRFTDPDGKNPLLIMGAAGSAVFGGWQVYQNVRQGRPWHENVGVEASKGLIIGATLGLAAPAVASLGAAEAASVGLGSSGMWVRSTEAMSSRAAAFQAQITGRAGQVFMQNGVKFDGLVHNILVEAKGPGYATFVQNGNFVSWFRGASDLISQAQRQLAAAGGRPIQWYFAEAATADATRALFKANNIKSTLRN